MELIEGTYLFISHLPVCTYTNQSSLHIHISLCSFHFPISSSVLYSSIIPNPLACKIYIMIVNDRIYMHVCSGETIESFNEIKTQQNFAKGRDEEGIK